VHVARASQQPAGTGDAFSLAPVGAVPERRADQANQGAQPFQAAAGVVNGAGHVVLAGELLLGHVDLLERNAARLLRERLLQFEPVSHLSRTPCNDQATRGYLGFARV
jgi:hypothetical protein